MELASDHIESIYPTYRKWYEACDYKLTSNEYNMEVTYSELNEISDSLPEQIEVATMKSVPIEDLKKAVFDVFKDSIANE